MHRLLKDIPGFFYSLPGAIVFKFNQILSIGLFGRHEYNACKYKTFRFIGLFTSHIGSPLYLEVDCER